MKDIASKPVIFVYTTAYDPFIGGAEIAIRETVLRLADRFDFYILTSRFDRRLPFVQKKRGATVVRLGIGKPFDKFLLPVTAFVTSVYLIFRLRPEKKIFWAVMASYGSIAASALKLFFASTPLILTLQEGDPEEHLRRSRFGLINLAMRFALSRIDFLTAISSYLLHVSWRFGYKKWGVVIPNGVDLTNFRREFPASDLDALRKSLGLKVGERVIITTSRLVPKNAIDSIIRALVHIREFDGKPVRLLVLGSGAEAPKLRELAVALRVSDHVLFVGSVSHEELPKFLRIADVFVRPSRSEGLGNAFLEAMAAEVPIVGTPVGGIPDFLEDERTGLFAAVDNHEDLAAKIKRIFSDSELRKKIVSGAKRFVVTRYDWERIADDFGGVFDRELEKSRKTSFVIATGIFPPDIGGPATYSELLEEELSKRNYRVSIVTYADPELPANRPLTEILQNVRHSSVFRVSRRVPKGLRHALYFLRVLLATLHADVVYAQDQTSAGLPAWMAARILRKKFFVKVTGDYAWEQGVQRFGVTDLLDDFQKKKYGPRVGVLRAFQRFVLRRADAVITPSQYIRTIVCGWGVPAERVTVIYNSVEIPERFPSQKETRAELGIDEKATVLLSVGRLVPWKGFAVLIEAFASVAKTHPTARLFIAGSGPEKALLEATILSTGAADRITFTGSVPHEKLFSYIRAADVFILNTGYEGLSHQLLEVMGMGTPVITTPVGGNKEIVIDRETGLLVGYNKKQEVEDAIRLLLDDARLARKLAHAGEFAALKFTPKKMVEELLTIIDVKK